MTETAEGIAEATADQSPPEGEAEQEPKTFDADYVEKLRKEAAKYRTEAKRVAGELEQARQASMSEAEKAVAEAESRGRTAAAVEFGKRLARTEFDAAAARRNPGYDAASALEFIDLGRFVGDDGEPDVKAIRAAVDRLVPEPAGAPSFDGGARTTGPAPQDMNALIRRGLGRS